MAKKPRKAAKSGAKARLEALAGYDIDEATAQSKSWWMPVGAYSFSDGLVTWRNIIRFLPKSCNDARLLDVSGVSSTGSDGKRVFRLSEFVCFGTINSLAEPINVVATPLANAPGFLTAQHQLIPATVDDVEITIFTWDASGAPAPNVVFDWRCRVVSNVIIL
jgi:hypothetical protein